MRISPIVDLQPASRNPWRNFSVLLVDDDYDDEIQGWPESQGYYTAALDELGVPYDVWDVAAAGTEPDAAALQGHNVVIWFSGVRVSGEGLVGPSAAEETLLADYLDGGMRCLFISSQDYAGEQGVTPFMTSYLGAAADSRMDLFYDTVQGVGPVFGSLGPYLFNELDGSGRKDGLVLTSSADPVFGFEDETRGENEYAAISQDAGHYRTTYWGFPLEILPDAAARQAALATVLNWCGELLNEGLTVEPDQVTLCREGHAEATLYANFPYTSPVTLALPDAPAGVTFDLGTAAVPVSGTRTLQFTVTGLLAGDYGLSIVGTNDEITRIADLTLDVLDAVPGRPVPAVPADGATGQSLTPDFHWNEAAAANTYILEVARDVDFSEIVYRTEVSGTEHLLQGMALQPRARYYWRVMAKNVCGGSVFSEAASFRTGLGLLLINEESSLSPNSYPDILQSLGESYTFTNTLPAAETLNAYKAVIWFSQEGGGFLTDGDQGKLAQFLDQGQKCLFIDALNFSSPLSAFPSHYFGISGRTVNVPYSVVTGTGSLPGWDASLNINNTVYFKNLVYPDQTAQTAFWGGVGTGRRSVAVMKEVAGRYRTFYTGFPFSAGSVISGGDKAALLEKLLDWCGFTPDFDLKPSTPALSICGSSGTLATTVALDSRDGYTGSVRLWAEGLPAGVGMSSNPQPLAAPGNQPLTLTLEQVAAGHYDWVLGGADGSLTHTARLGLTVAEVAPAGPGLSGPDSIVPQSLSPVLTWEPVPLAADYELEIAADSGFAQEVYTAVVHGQQHIPLTGLAPLQTYYWRVRARNACGAGGYSETGTFVTAGPIVEAYSSVEPSALEAVADAEQTVWVTATLRDALNRPAAYRAIRLEAGGWFNWITPTVGRTDAAGRIVFQLASSLAETKTLMLRDGDYGGTVPAGAIVFKPGAPAGLQLLLPGEVAVPGRDPGKGGLPGVQGAGVPFTVTVRAVDRFWNLIPTVTDTVDLISSDPGFESPAAVSLAEGTARIAVTFTKTGYIEDLQARDVSDPAVPGFAGSQFYMGHGIPARLSLALPETVRAFEPFTGTLTVYDAYDNPVVGYDGRVNFSSSDATATLPPAEEIAPFNTGGVKVLGGAFVLIVPGQSVITAADALIPQVLETASVNVTPPEEPVVITQDTVLDGSHEWVFDHLTVSNGARLRLQSPVTVTAEGITVEAGAAIEVDGRGYGPGEGPGSGQTRLEQDLEVMQLWVADYYLGAGGGHGGVGGTHDPVVQPGAAYGDLYMPTTAGSAGGSSTGGSGGGALHLVVSGTLRVDGRVSAAGAAGTERSLNGGEGWRGGGGAGGSLWIECGTLAGAGTVQSDGGAGYHTCYFGRCSRALGGGSGGRVAIYAGVNNFTGAIQAEPGSGGSQPAQRGTVYLAGVDPAESTVELAAVPPLVPDGVQSATLTVTLVTTGGQPVAGAPVSLALVHGTEVQGNGQTLSPETPVLMGNSDAAGQRVIVLTSTHAGTKVLAVWSGAVRLLTPIDLQFVPGSPDGAASSITVAPGSLVADGVTPAIVTATVRDNQGNEVPGQAVVLSAEGISVTVESPNAVTDEQGQVRGRVFTTRAQMLTVQAFLPGAGITLTDQPEVGFGPGAISLDASTLEITPTGVPADGITPVIGTVRVVDAFGNPIPDRRVEISSDSGEVNFDRSYYTTDADGRISFEAYSEVIHVATLSAWVQDDFDRMPLNAVVQPAFVGRGVDPLVSTVEVGSDAVVADGVQQAVITVTLRDTLGNPFADHVVALQVSGHNNRLQGPYPALTGADGAVTFTLTSTRAEEKSILATDQTDEIELFDNPSVLFVAGAVDPETSRMWIFPGAVLADAQAWGDVFVQATDAYYNPVAGAVVELATSAEQALLEQPGQPTGGNGETVGKVRDAVSEAVTVTAKINGVALPQSATVTFALPDLQVTQTGPWMSQLDGPISYTLRVINQGTVSAPGVMVTDTLPENTAFTAQQATAAFTRTGNLLIWDVGMLESGATAQIVLSTTPASTLPAKTRLVNRVSATTSASEPIATNNAATLTTHLGVPDVNLVALPDYIEPIVSPGSVQTLGLQLVNSGTLTSTGGSLLSPVNLPWVTVEPANWPELGPGASLPITLTLAPPAELRSGDYLDELYFDGGEESQAGVGIGVHIRRAIRDVEFQVTDGVTPVVGAEVVLVARAETVRSADGITTTLHQTLHRSSGDDGRAELTDLEVGIYDYTVAAPLYGGAQGVITVTEGSGLQSVPVTLTAVPLLISESAYPELVVRPGETAEVATLLRNAGLNPAQGIRVELPTELPWLASELAGNVEALDAGEALSLTLFVHPPATTTVPAVYVSSVEIQADNAAPVPLALKIRVTDQETGTLQLHITDPENKPLVDTRVTVLSKEPTLVMVHGVTETHYESYEGTTDAAGWVTFEGIPAGRYDYYAHAEGYQPLSVDPEVTGGGVTSEDVVLRPYLFKADWHVRQIGVTDSYTAEVVLEYHWDTVIRIKPLLVNIPCGQDYVEGYVEVTNYSDQPVAINLEARLRKVKGGADRVINIVGDTKYIGPNSTISVPYRARYIRGRSSYQGTIYAMANGEAVGAAPFSIASCRWAWGSADDASDVLIVVGNGNIIPNFDEFEGPGAEIPGGYVQFKLSQEVVLERQAFLAELTLRDSLKVITDIQVEITARDLNGEVVSNYFVVTPTVPTALPDLRPSHTVNKRWTLVPGYQGLTETTQYLLQATIRYKLNGQSFEARSLPASIVVEPLPMVNLSYFAPQFVLGNQDPVLISVVAENTGHGVAHDFRIISAPPDILSQSEGALVSVALVGAVEDGEEKPGDIILNFGEIEPGEVVTGAWMLQISRPGHFVKMNVRCSHSTMDGMEISNLVYCANGENQVDNRLQFLSGDDGDCPDISNEDKQSQVGGPINTYSGNYGYGVTDISLPTVGDELKLERIYNSAYVMSDTDVLGPGWTHAYAMRLEFPDLDGQVHFTGTFTNPVLNRAAVYYRPYVQVRLPGGGRLRLADNGDGTYSAYPGSATVLREIETDGVVTYTLVAADGMERIFDAAGRLQLIRNRNGNEIRFRYGENGKLQRVEDETGQRGLDFHYNNRGWVDGVEDSAGRHVGYEYDAAGDLITVADVLGQLWHYTYLADHRLSEVVDPSGHLVERTEYDDAGRAIRQTDRAGIVTTLEYKDGETVITTGGRQETHYYNLLGVLTGKRDMAGNLTTFDSNSEFRRTAVVDPLGQETRIEWGDGCSQLSVITNTLGQATRMIYDEQGNLVRYVDSTGQATLYGHDSSNNVISQTNPLSQTAQYAYNEQGQLISMTVPGGLTRLYQYDSLGQRVAMTDTQGQVTTYGYDALGRLITETVDGIVKVNTYDHANRLIGVIEHYTSTTSELNYLGTYNLATKYRYDTLNHLIEMNDPFGRGTRWEYNEKGQLVREWRVFADEVLPSQRTSYFYDELGRQILVVDNLDRETYTEYDVLNRPVRIWQNYQRESWKECLPGNRENCPEPYNRVTEFEYDALGRIVRVTDSLGKVTFTEYDILGRVSRIWENYRADYPVAWENTYNLVTTYGYDELGHQTWVTDTSDQATYTEYDALGRPITVTSHYQDGHFDPDHPDEDLIAVTEYDAAGRVARTIDPASRITAYEYDRWGRLVTTTVNYEGNGLFDPAYPDHNLRNIKVYDDRGRLAAQVQLAEIPVTTTYQYDSWGRLVTTTNALSGTTVSDYNAQGQRVELIDAEQHTTRYEYDPAGRLIRTVNPDGGTVEVEYDALGRQAVVTDGMQGRTAYIYDVAGQIVEQVDPLGNRTQYGYDPLGRQTVITDADGVTIYSIYDSLGRIIATRDGSGHETAYAYNALGLRTAMTNANHIVTHYEYDRQGRLAALVENFVPEGPVDAETNVRTVYTYDINGNRRSVQDALGHTTVYTYDTLNRLVAESDPLGNSTRYVYDGLGRQVATVHPDAGGPLTTTAEYNALGWPIRIDYPAVAGVPEFSIAYDYNLTGQRRAVTDTLGSMRYDYRELYQPLAVTAPTGEVRYDYDHAGRRTRMTFDGKRLEYTHDAAGRLIRVVDWKGETTRYTYTPAGRLSQIELPNGVSIHYGYDLAGRLNDVQAFNAAQEPLSHYEYALDDLGNRVAVTETLALASTPALDADFKGSPLSGPAPLDVFFKDNSTRPVSAYYWDFGDGTTAVSTDRGIDHRYTEPGSYTVTLRINSLGREAVERKVDFVQVQPGLPPLVADFSASVQTGLAPLGVAFTDLSSGEAVTEYQWDFGDGFTSTVRNPLHYYLEPGNFTVTLRVSGPNGMDIEQKTGYISVTYGIDLLDYYDDFGLNRPWANAWSWAGDSWEINNGALNGNGMSYPDSPAVSHFQPAGAVQDCLTSVYRWAVREGSARAGMEICAQSANGSYQIVDTGTTVDVFQLRPENNLRILYASFPVSPSNGAAVHVYEARFEELPYPDYALKIWRDGEYLGAVVNGGAPGSGQGISLYAWDGITQFEWVRITDDWHAVPMAPAATFTYGPRDGTGPLAVTFTNRSAGNISSYLWDFGDGYTSSLTSPVHVYFTPGEYTVNLRVTGAGGSDMAAPWAPTVRISRDEENILFQDDFDDGTVDASWSADSGAWAESGGRLSGVALSGEPGVGTRVVAFNDSVEELGYTMVYCPNIAYRWSIQDGNTWAGLELCRDVGGLNGYLILDKQDRVEIYGLEDGTYVYKTQFILPPGTSSLHSYEAQLEEGLDQINLKLWRDGVYLGTASDLGGQIYGPNFALHVWKGRADFNWIQVKQVGPLWVKNIPSVLPGDGGWGALASADPMPGPVALWAGIGKLGVRDLLAGISTLRSGEVGLGWLPELVKPETIANKAPIALRDRDTSIRMKPVGQPFAQSGGLLSRTILYEYDPLNRLVSARYSSGESWEYTYDAVGNRTSMAVGKGGLHTYEYDAANHLISADGVTYTWDARGNLLNDGIFTYTYNGAGQLVRAQSLTDTLVYTYNADGLRVLQNINGFETPFIWDWAAEQPEVLQAGRQAYLIGNETFGFEDEIDGRIYYLPDALGSIRQKTDGAGTVVDVEDWDPYGGGVPGSIGPGYAGEWHDAAAGTQYLRARWYQPALGRFIQPDPWRGDSQMPMSYNRWLYTYANPVNLTDPTGKFPEWCKGAESPWAYQQCVLDYYKSVAFGGAISPIGEWELPEIEGHAGCYEGTVPYRAPGYLEGFSDSATPGTSVGIELVYDFATMESGVVSFAGVAVGDSINIASGMVYVGVATGFRSDHNLVSDYTGTSVSGSIGASVGIWAFFDLSAGAGVLHSCSSSDFRMCTDSIYFGLTSGIDYVPVVDLSIGGSYYPDATLAHEYYIDSLGYVDRTKLGLAIVSGRYSPWTPASSIPMLGVLLTGWRGTVATMAMSYAWIYEDIRGLHDQSN